jgi:rhodanese-related sulfurtransferase
LSRSGPTVGVVLALLPRIIRRIRGQKPFRWVEVPEVARGVKHADAAIIDVRGADEFVGRLGHIPGARNFPVGELPQRLPELAVLHDQPVVLVCRTDKRSANAAAMLHDAGFSDVRVLRGGMEQWNREGLGTEGRNAITPA